MVGRALGFIAVFFVFATVLIGFTTCELNGLQIEGIATRQSSQNRLTIENVLITLVDDLQISVRESGFVERIVVKEGQFVALNGELVLLVRQLHEIDRNSAKTEFEIAKAKSENDVDLQYAKKSSAFADVSYQRTKRANERSPGAFGSLEVKKFQLDAERERLKIVQAERDLELARMETELKRQQLQAAEFRLELRNLRSPIAGQVVEVFAQPGEWVNAGSPVVRVIGLEQMRVAAKVDGKKYGRELLNRSVELQVRLPPAQKEAMFFGKVSFVSPEMDPTTGLIMIWAEVENTNMALRAGARGRLRIASE